MHFLVKHFTFLGFEIQLWMLIAVGLVIAFVFFAWRTQNRI
jgi:nitrate reductase NapE component